MTPAFSPPPAIVQHRDVIARLGLHRILLRRCPGPVCTSRTLPASCPARRPSRRSRESSRNALSLVSASTVIFPLIGRLRRLNVEVANSSAAARRCEPPAPRTCRTSATRPSWRPTCCGRRWSKRRSLPKPGLPVCKHRIVVLSRDDAAFRSAGFFLRLVSTMPYTSREFSDALDRSRCIVGVSLTRNALLVLVNQRCAARRSLP